MLRDLNLPQSITEHTDQVFFFFPEFSDVKFCVTTVIPIGTSQWHICMYIWGLRAHQHLRSLVPIMNDDNAGQMIFGDLGGLKHPDIC